MTQVYARESVKAKNPSTNGKHKISIQICVPNAKPTEQSRHGGSTNVNAAERQKTNLEAPKTT
jgi:hypothetical protein